MLGRYPMLTGFVTVPTLAAIAATLYLSLGTDTDTDDKTHILTTDSATPDEVEIAAETPQPSLPLSILLNPVSMENTAVTLSPPTPDIAYSFTSNLDLVLQHGFSAPVITADAAQVAEPVLSEPLNITPVNRVFTTAATPQPAHVISPSYPNFPLVMAYAPIDDDYIIAPFDEVFTALQTETITPTRQATATEASCSGSRWSILDDQGTVLADSENRALIACPMASLTKVMTIYLAFQAFADNPDFDPDTQITIPRAITNHVQPRAHTPVAGTGRSYSAGYLAALAGRQSDAIATLGLAYAVGEAFGYTGTVDEVLGGVIQLMNYKAQELGLTNTRFNNPVGFTNQYRLTDFADTANVSTAEDMARLLMATYTLNPEWTEHALGNDEYYTMRHTLRAVRRNTVDFGKTGTTDAAGRAAVFSLEIDGERVFAAMLGAPRGTRNHHVDAALRQARTEVGEAALEQVRADTPTTLAVR